MSPLAHVASRLRSATVVDDPFPHFYVENIFPDDYYDALLRHLPDSGVYQNLYEVTDLKLDHFRHRDQRDFKDGWTERLPPTQKEFWDDFHDWFLGAELAQAALDSFGAQMGGRRPAVSVESQLIRHRAGYFLGPHSDANTKLVVLLLYLAPHDGAEHLGTSLYRPKDPDFGCPFSRHYPFEDFVKVKTAPYRPNSVLAFFRSDQSFHGVEPLAEQDVLAAGGRDLIQYVVYDRDAREAQLRARQEKTA
jgi:hypothetical protein